MSYNHENKSHAYTVTRAAAYHPRASGIAMPAVTALQKKPVVQRVIAGLENYQLADNIPDNWVNSYHNDLKNTDSFLSEDQVWNVFERVIGPGEPYQYGIAINHEGGDHWTLSHNDINYKIMGDGNCGLHAVHLARHLLFPPQEAILVDPTVSYAAPEEFVREQRQALYDSLTHEDNLDQSNDEAKKHISLAIKNAEFIIETGGGATTNVTQTVDWNAPHDPALWAQQEQSTISGIQQLSQVSLEEGQVYNMNAQTYLQRLHDEPEDQDPTQELIDESYKLMMSPNPYINNDDEDPLT